jgi:hypothetical protein
MHRRAVGSEELVVAPQEGPKPLPVHLKSLKCLFGAVPAGSHPRPHVRLSTPATHAGRVTATAGWTGAEIDSASDANAFGTRSATPFLTARHPGGTRWYVSQIRLSH